MMVRLSRCLPIILFSRNAGIAVTTKAMIVEAERMSEGGAVSAFAPRKRGKKFGDAFAKKNRQAENGSELNHDGVHLPIAAGEADVEQGFSDAQMRGGADGDEFGDSFDDAEKQRDQVIVQASSRNYYAFKEFWTSKMRRGRRDNSVFGRRSLR